MKRLPLLLLTAVLLARAHGDEPAPLAGEFSQLSDDFDARIHKILKSYCNECHSTETKEGELDLERFGSLQSVRRDPPAWQAVARMLDSGEMPPEDSLQPSAEEKTLLRGWVKRYLDTEARAAAGDPGPVILRRLNNAEYTYTIRELTGVDLDPAREFPVDGAAGEGFTNTGNSLAMSPALLEKYVAAAKGIADHMVLLPDGFRFSEGDTPRDWTNELMARIRAIYHKHTGDASNASLLDHWNVADPKLATLEDGRVDLKRYIAGLIRHRKQLRAEPGSAAEIARSEKLNAKYFARLTRMLYSDDDASLLLEWLQRRCREATPDESPVIAAEIRQWQDRLWKFNPVGHFGSIRPWQEATDPIAAFQEFRIKTSVVGDSSEVRLYLIARPAGHGSETERVLWSNPRIERAGRPAIALRDVRGIATILNETRDKFMSKAEAALSAAYELRGREDHPDVRVIAAKHSLTPADLNPWLAALGIAHGGDVEIKQYLTQPISGLDGNRSVSGWGLAGASALSIQGNSSDQDAKIPGDMRAHHVTVHPRPERWVAAGWKSPIDGRVRLVPHVRDAHNACGNGISWSVELRHGSQRRILRSGNVDLGGAATIEPVENLDVHRGDLISVVIDARDRNHVCDLTEIDLEIAETGGEKRAWSLSKDCADSMSAGNPHADRFGNAAVWHFYYGDVDDADRKEVIPAGSLVAQWLSAGDPATAAGLAKKIQTLLTKPLTGDASDADAAIYRQFRSIDGPLLSQIDLAARARSSGHDLSKSEWGLDPSRFAGDSNNLTVRVSDVVEIRIPAELCRDAEFVVTGALAPDSGPGGSVQLEVATAPPDDLSIRPGLPFVVRSGSEAEKNLKQSLNDFREVFPAVLCYPQIVPVDEVVTLVLHHREDRYLMGLMLDEREQAELNRLWAELRYVSRDPLAIVTGFEQLMEFATQDADPKVFEPLRKPIMDDAARFREELVASEPSHLKQMIEFTAKAFRRPLTEEEEARLRAFYQALRDDGLPHDESLRMTLVRVLSSPAFLYRLERPGPGTKPTPVSNWELASRLSYFLWSSPPNEALRHAAAEGTLVNDEELVHQAHRMLKDTRARRMAIEFACQWLHVRNFDQFDEKNESLFPQFAELRGLMYEESIRFFTDLFQRDGSVLEILDGDHTFLNERLAAHYGVDGISGDEWRRVEGIHRYGRGGVLGQGTILSKASGASRTSPVLRGDWITETLLGERLPRPPKNVPQLPETVPEGLTARQLIAHHSETPSCAKCHLRIDPFGFTLENFDTIGRFRKTGPGDVPLDVSADLPDGTHVEGAEGLRRYLSTNRRDDFLKQFCRKLLGYALGRSVRLSDEPLLAKMAEDLKNNDYHFSVAVEAVVLSPQFRRIRGRDFTKQTANAE